MKITFAVLTAGAGLFLSALPVLAHHSFAAEFDATKPVSVKGTVTAMDWVNPHSWLRFDVKTEDGKVEHWSAECLPPNGLYRQGWRKDSVKIGDRITVTAYLAKDASSTASIRLVTTPDGRKVFAGTADDGGPKQ